MWGKKTKQLISQYALSPDDGIQLNTIKTYFSVHVVTTLLTLCSITYPNPTRIRNILLVTSADFKTSWNFKNQIVYTSNPQSLNYV